MQSIALWNTGIGRMGTRRMENQTDNKQISRNIKLPSQDCPTLEFNHRFDLMINKNPWPIETAEMKTANLQSSRRNMLLIQE
jgi:hypothetical protein